MEKSTCVKLDVEVNRLTGFTGFNRSSTVRVLRVALDVHEAVEVGVADVDGDLDSVGQAIDDDVGSGKVGLDDWRWWNWNC